LALEGYQPLLDACAICGAEERLVAFDLSEGGTLCRSCRRGVALSPQALNLIRRILGGDLAGALDEPPGPAAHEVEHLASRALEHHLERRLRTLRMLEHS
jgi:DNA repair protein RecO (recombination protein O)